MHCENCQIDMIEKKATVKDPYRDDLSGLSNVYLAGITVHYCPRCKVESPIIPRVDELHREITQVLIRKPGLLNGEEIRFLRKQAGFPAQKFAALLGVTPEHLSRVENGRTANFGTSADRLARAIAATANDGESARDILLKIADELEDNGDVADQRPLFKLQQNHWKAAA